MTMDGAAGVADEATRFRFGTLVLDAGTVELRDGDEVIALEPQTFAVLAYLVRNRDRVVPKTELLDNVWGDRFVSESALTTRIKHVRRVVGDDGREQAVVRTIHGVGYRFVADVEEEIADSEPASRDVLASVSLRVSARPLFGRDRELADLRRRLEDHRLVTVTGPGGVGKSTLAARLVSERSTGDGSAWWCELANTRDPGALATVVLSALGERQQADADPVESVLRVLQRRSALIVLDNCEHVVTAAANLVGNVLRRCPGIVVVTTSRMPLHVTGESILPLAPLGPDDAIACFCARALDAGVRLDPTDRTVVDLCSRLDGIPLALELAASRSLALSPSQMIELLDHRFRLLTAPDATDDDRHASLERTIRWSVEALGDGDRRLLDALSTLVGRFSLLNAASIAGPDSDVLDLAASVDRLAQASLIDVVGEPTAPHRFRLLESIRDFATEQLADPDEVRRRHREYFARRAAEIDDGPLQSTDVDRGLEEMRGLWDNLRAAVGYAAQAGDVDTVRRIIVAVGPCADLYQTFEVLDWCRHADLHPDDADNDELPLVADAVAIEARLIAHRGQWERAMGLAEDAHRRHQSLHTVLSLIWCCYYGGDLARVLELASDLRAMSRSTRGMDMAFADGFEGIVAAVQEEPGATSTTVTPDVAERGALGAFDCLFAGFQIAVADPASAGALFEAVIDEALANDYWLLFGAAASSLINIVLPAQPTMEAMSPLRRVLFAYRDRGMWTLISADIVMAARLLADVGDTDLASRLLGARDSSGYNVGTSEVHRAELTADLEAADPERFSRLRAEGTRWRPLDAADAAIAALDRHVGSSAAQDPAYS